MGGSVLPISENKEGRNKIFVLALSHLLECQISPTGNPGPSKDNYLRFYALLELGFVFWSHPL